VTGRLVLLLLLAGAAPGAAQTLSPQLERSWMSVWSNGPPASGIAPALWLDGGRVGYGLVGAVSFGLREPEAPVHGSTPSAPRWLEPPRGALLELGLRGLDAAARRDPSAAAASARLHLAGGPFGAWLATGGLALGDGSGRLPLLGGGVWLRGGGLTVTTQVVQLLRPIHVGDPAPPMQRMGDSSVVVVVDRRYPEDDARLLTGIETGLGWVGERMELHARAGIARGADPPHARWGELRAIVWAIPGAALFAAVRSTAHLSDAIESVQGHRAVVGIQLAPGRRPMAPESRPDRVPDGFAVEPAGSGNVRLVLAARAQTVEVSCDATGWLAVPALPSGPDLWAVVLPLGPGLHRIAMRVDAGPWQAPPGLPKAQDDFGGEVGLLVVR
jgi:hypothetical protein